MSDAIEAAIRTAAEGLEATEASAGAESTDPIDTGGDEGVSDGSDPGADSGGGAADSSADGSESTGTGDAGEGSGDPAAVPPKDKPSEDPDEAELRALEKELSQKEPNIRKGHIPTSRHQAVLTRERRKHAAVVEELTGKVKAFEAPETQERLAAITLAERDPDTFVNRILMNDSRYQQVINRLVEAKVQERTNAPAVPGNGAAAAPADEPRPKPDVVLADGTVVYSREQNEKLIEWTVRQERAAHKKEMDELRQQVEPVVTAHGQAQDFQTRLVNQKKILDNARASWPQFKENEPAMREWLAQNRAKGLEDAYRAVVIPLLLTDREKIKADMRALVLKEMEGNSAGAGVRPGGMPPVTTGGGDGMDPVEAAIRKSIRGIK